MATALTLLPTLFLNPSSLFQIPSIRGTSTSCPIGQQAVSPHSGRGNVSVANKNSQFYRCRALLRSVVQDELNRSGKISKTRLPYPSKLMTCAQASKQVLSGHGTRAATLPAGPGGGVLDKATPTLERPTPGREAEFNIKRKKKVSPPYRVLLHNDNFNRREYVVQVLMKIIPGMTVDQAVNIMQEAHVNGMACVIICAQEDAEEHCQGLRTNGLIASIEPANN